MPWDRLPEELRVDLPFPLSAEGLQSAHGSFRSTIVPAFDGRLIPPTIGYGVFGDKFYPLGGIAACAVPLAPILSCRTAVLYKNDGLSRCSLVVNTAVIDANTEFPFMGAYRLEFQVRVAVGNNPGTVVQVSKVINKADPICYGPFVVCSGFLGTQWEIWGRTIRFDAAVPPDPLNPQPPDLQVSFHMVVDRMGDRQDNQAIPDVTIVPIDFPYNY